MLKNNSELRTSFEEGQVLLFDKPQYWTSFDLVNKIRLMIRSSLKIKKIKVGHAGTLDPLATGLMIICTGKFTKKIEEFSNLEKEYIASIRFGETTPSFDLETEPDGKFPTDHITVELISDAIKGFLGEQLQIPPLYSAKFIDGKRAYEYARKGVDMKLEPVRVFFSEIELLGYTFPEARIRMICSKGTYIRSFARDFGAALKSGAYLSALQRSSIGSYRLKDAWTMENFEKYLQQTQQT
jgi:tRNA pseudouridine55 synthase